eukprot:gene22729-28885_t
MKSSPRSKWWLLYRPFNVRQNTTKSKSTLWALHGHFSGKYLA